jgi:hypothetical protein
MLQGGHSKTFIREPGRQKYNTHTQYLNLNLETSQLRKWKRIETHHDTKHHVISYQILSGNVMSS